MANAAEKARFANACQQTATLLARCINEMKDQAKAYVQRFYGAGGADEIQVADLAEVPGVVPADLNLWIGFCNEQVKFAGNVDPANADYNATLAVMRTDV